jgi:hypothetical protein
MAQELVGADAFIYATLAGDTALAAIVGTRIYADVAPSLPTPPTYPLVLFSLQSSRDVVGIGTYRAMTTPTYLVRVIGKGGGFGAIQAAADRIDALLTVRAVQSVTIGGVTFSILGSVRERPFQRSEEPEGILYRHLGGFYRLNVA